MGGPEAGEKGVSCSRPPPIPAIHLGKGIFYFLSGILNGLGSWVWDIEWKSANKISADLFPT